MYFFHRLLQDLYLDQDPDQDLDQKSDKDQDQDKALDPDQALDQNQVSDQDLDIGTALFRFRFIDDSKTQTNTKT